MHTLSTSRAAPSHFSPSAAELASFSRMTGLPNFCWMASRTGKFAQPGRFGDSCTMPESMSMMPGTPTPIPSTVPGNFCASWRMAAHISVTTCSRPRATCVLVVIFSISLPSVETAAMRRLVPPRSTPMASADIAKQFTVYGSQ